MELINTVNLFLKSDKKLFTTKDISQILRINTQRTLENRIKKLIDTKVITPLEKGKYILTDSNVTDFEISQFLYSPSYISFETALNYHGILSQFPFEIISATTKKSKSKEILGKTYTYTKISKQIYTGYYKLDNCLMAYPEKALFDQLYMIALKKKSAEYLNEMDYTNIKKREVEKYIYLLPKRLKKPIKILISQYL
ncbi:MAG: type IV toxin-antitoxin system AbiEi family antitoxin domain-containing protein [Candidatus Dojkabacteria bacterium]|jgi:predicted transcriptional regulator of viral defense system